VLDAYIIVKSLTDADYSPNVGLTGQSLPILTKGLQEPNSRHQSPPSLRQSSVHADSLAWKDHAVASGLEGIRNPAEE
jgi:hypothetical protein